MKMSNCIRDAVINCDRKYIETYIAKGNEIKDEAFVWSLILDHKELIPVLLPGIKDGMVLYAKIGSFKQWWVVFINEISVYSMNEPLNKAFFSSRFAEYRPVLLNIINGPVKICKADLRTDGKYHIRII